MMELLVENTQSKSLSILLLEDDEGDAKAVIRAFKKARIANPVYRAIDGVEALKILRGENGKEKIPSPYIILADINMPRMDGIEFVKQLRADPQHRQAIVFMLTTSKSDEDKFRAYDLNVAGYIVKEAAGRDFLKLIDMLGAFWRIVELPQP